MGWLLSCLLKDWEGNSGQEQCGSRRIVLINKETRHRKFNYRRVKTVVFVSKQVFVSWFFQVPFPVLLGTVKTSPCSVPSSFSPHAPSERSHLAHWKSNFSSNFSFLVFPSGAFFLVARPPPGQRLSNLHVPKDTQSLPVILPHFHGAHHDHAALFPVLTRPGLPGCWESIKKNLNK